MSLTKASYSMITGAVVNVLDFGADPTNTNDSTSAFNAAISSISSAGANSGTVFVPKGQYKIAGTINCNYSGIIIKGQGASSQLNYTGTGTAIHFVNSIANARVGNCGTDSISLTTSTGSIGILVDSGEYVNINNVYIQGFLSVGISFTAGNNNFGQLCFVTNSQIIYCVDAIRFGVSGQTFPVNASGIMNTRLGGNGNTGFGISLLNCSNISITNGSDIEGFDRGVYVNGASNVWVTQTTIEQNNYGVYLDGTNGASSIHLDAYVSGNTTSNFTSINGANGVQYNPSSGLITSFGNGGYKLPNGYAYLVGNTTSGAATAIFGAATGVNLGVAGNNAIVATSAGNSILFGATDTNSTWAALSGSAYTPGVDNAFTLGSSSYRWSTVYAATGTINTSDANQKQDVSFLDVAEQATAKAIKGLMKKFKFKSSVAKKGASARYHFGVIAQEVKAAFEANGLDASNYGVFCSDTWHTLNGEVVKDNTEGATAVTQLGIRYDELLCFVIGAM